MKKNPLAKEMTSRLEKMLVNDKTQAPEGFEKLLCYDLERLLNDYFELSTNVSLQISLAHDSEFEISIKTNATRFKSFSMIE